MSMNLVRLGTLLNHLFGTEFQIMDEKARKQTTKGIWLNKAPDSSILVMDVEGTDGRERGENQVETSSFSQTVYRANINIQQC